MHLKVEKVFYHKIWNVENTGLVIEILGNSPPRKNHRFIKIIAHLFIMSHTPKEKITEKGKDFLYKILVLHLNTLHLFRIGGVPRTPIPLHYNSLSCIYANDLYSEGSHTFG